MDRELRARERTACRIFSERRVFDHTGDALGPPRGGPFLQSRRQGSISFYNMLRLLARSRASLYSTTSTACGVSVSPEFGTYPGDVKIAYTTSFNAHPPSDNPIMPCFRIMDEDGSIRAGAVDPGVGRDVALRIYTTMSRLQTMDSIFYEGSYFQTDSVLTFFLLGLCSPAARQNQFLHDERR